MWLHATFLTHCLPTNRISSRNTRFTQKTHTHTYTHFALQTMDPPSSSDHQQHVAELREAQKMYPMVLQKTHSLCEVLKSDFGIDASFKGANLKLVQEFSACVCCLFNVYTRSKTPKHASGVRFIATDALVLFGECGQERGEDLLWILKEITFGGPHADLRVAFCMFFTASLEAVSLLSGSAGGGCIHGLDVFGARQPRMVHRFVGATKGGSPYCVSFDSDKVGFVVGRVPEDASEFLRHCNFWAPWSSCEMQPNLSEPFGVPLELVPNNYYDFFPGSDDLAGHPCAIATATPTEGLDRQADSLTESHMDPPFGAPLTFFLLPFSMIPSFWEFASMAFWRDRELCARDVVKTRFQDIAMEDWEISPIVCASMRCLYVLVVNTAFPTDDAKSFSCRDLLAEVRGDRGVNIDILDGREFILLQPLSFYRTRLDSHREILEKKGQILEKKGQNKIGRAHV